MSIFTKLKTATDFSASAIKEGFALIWPEKKSDGSVSLQVKLEDGSVQEIGGGSAGDAAVRIYDATVEPSTGVVTITDGTQVADLAIGDEIRTPDGVYQKIKDSITIVSPADGTRIKVSGITTPEEFNGVYILTETEKVWKHESADCWILQSISQSSDSYWMIANTRSPSYPGEANFIASCSISSMPWEMSDWVAMIGYGSPVLENASTEQTVTDTLALFEYASLPVKPENIVQSVNGKKPDASGNVTIETGGGTVDESRLLPDPQSISSEKSGFPLVFKSDYVADSSFILCFPFDGDIVDYSTNRVQVTNDYVTLASDVPEGSGQSAYFNTNACLRGTLPVVLGTSDLTINAWIKLQHTGSNQTFFSTRDGNASSSEAFSFDVHDDGELFMYSTSEHTSRISSAEKMTFGVWHHVRMIRSSNTVKLYLDGKLHAEGTCSNNWTWTAFAIGMLYRKNDSYNQLKGYMSAFQLLNYAMPLEEFTPVFDYGIDINKRFEVAEDNLCDDAISAHNQDASAHPDKLSLTGGQMTGELKINATNAVRINNGDYGVFFRKDASSFYIMVTAQGDPNGSYTDARPLKIDLATGDCYINGGATKDSNGNVITTTYAPLSHPTFTNGVEITGTTPYIDFHYNNSESDYTFRVVQNSEDTLTLDGKVAVSNTLTVTAGGMSVAGGIKNTGEIQSESSNSYRIISGNYGTFWRNDGRDLYLMLTNSGDQYGSYNSFRPLTVDLATGVCNISGSAVKTESNLSSTGVYPTVSMNTNATDDFNTYKTQGNYWFKNGVRPNGPLGDDAETTGVLSVYNIRDTHTLQVYNLYRGTSVSTQQMYYRWCYNGTWTSWSKLLTSMSDQVANADFNTMLTQGFYFANGAKCVNGPLSPATSQGWVTVKAIQNGKHALQFYYGFNTDDFFARRYTNNAWANWVRIPTAESKGATTNNYNTLTEPGDYYLSYGDNTSNVNAPANGPFHILVHRYQNAAGTAKPVLQIAASQVVSETQTPMMFFRSAAYANSAWTFQPWLRLLTEKDVTYNTGTAGGSLTRNDYIKIGNVIVYIGSVNLRLNSGTTFALPVLSNNMTFVASCNTYVSTITMLGIYLDSDNRLNIDIRGTRSESATDDQVNVGWIGVGYLN